MKRSVGRDYFLFIVRAEAAFGAVSVAMLVVMIDIALFAPSTTGRGLEEVAD